MTAVRRFAIAAVEELWCAGRLIEHRLLHGCLEERGDRIDASDAPDEELVERANVEVARCTEARLHPAVRIVGSSRRTSSVVDACSIVLTIGGLSILTGPDFFVADAEWLRSIAAARARDAIATYAGVPLVWKSGSASVLLHEAVGHAAEHGHTRLNWPEWLTVRDEPGSIDDCGRMPEAVDLLSGLPPDSMRRESFTHPALPRMSKLVAAQSGAPFALPERHIDIHLLAGGHYEPLTETVSVFVAAADLVDGGMTKRLAPFTIRESRADVARSMIGARGETVRYPGVVCSFEGQELVVGSHAPEIVTLF